MLMRRRSRDARTTGPTGHQHGEPKTQQRYYGVRPRTLIYATLVLSITAILLLARFQWDNIRQSLFSSIASHEHLLATKDGFFTLHPEDHVDRQPATLRHKWLITKQAHRPDGVLKQVYCINGLFPGPTLEARSGDRLVIEVENGLSDEGLSLHWHGLSMRGANHMDGAVGVTQNPIASGDTCIYDFTIEEHQHGTFWYHAHSQVQRADGLYGGLVIHEPGSRQIVDNERLLLVGDWYHRTAETALDFYMHPGSFGNEPVPDSILLNGLGVFNCADAVPARPLDCQHRDVESIPRIDLNSKARNVLRVVNVGSYAGIQLSMDRATLTPLRVDAGHSVSGETARRVGYVHPGERVDLDICRIGTDSSINYHLEVSLDTSSFKYQNPALSPTHQFLAIWHNERATGSSEDHAIYEHVTLENIRSAEDQSEVIPHVADTTMVLYAITQKLSHLGNVPHGFINGTTWKPQAAPFSPLVTSSRESWDKNQFVPHVQHVPDMPLWIDIVLNNLDEEGHPFHLHGYQFWVLSTYSSTYNWGSYNPFEDEEAPGGNYDLVGALKKDTVLVPRRGYAVLRLKADNPGLWLLHCHNLWHQASGMAMAIEVR